MSTNSRKEAQCIVLLFILQSLSFTHLYSAFNPKIFNKKTITDISQTSHTNIARHVKPRSVSELQTIVRHAKRPISVAGGRFSQGGHIAYPGGIVVDMTRLNRIIHFDYQHKRITVQAGIRWREIQQFIVPFNFAIKVMQSYNDFTVGGSLSVNVHGRDIHYGPLVETIESIQIILADGSLKTASRSTNPELFAAAIGGYGAVGIITQATLSLTENCDIMKTVKQMPVEDYPAFFKNVIKNHAKATLHNTNIYPPDFKIATSITWHKTTHPLTIADQLQQSNSYYFGLMLGEQALRRLPVLHKLRPHIDKNSTYTPCVVTRNYEMSTPVNTLEPLLRFPTTTVLQEYFIPMDNLLSFIEKVREIKRRYGINILNISIRYVPENKDSILSYAQRECFSLVFYINIYNTTAGLAYAQEWTRRLIDSALALNGCYYLPYQLFSTLEQFHKAYPRYQEFKAVKRKYDPLNKFTNNFLKKYEL